MKSQKLTFIAAAIGVIAIAAIACGSEPVASSQPSDVAPPAGTEDRIPAEPDGFKPVDVELPPGGSHLSHALAVFQRVGADFVDGLTRAGA